MQFDTEDTIFTAYTRKNADRDIIGWWKSRLARLFSSGFALGSLLHIVKGKTTASGDTLKLKGILTSAMGNYYIIGYELNGSLHARLADGRMHTIGSLNASRNVPQMPLEDYTAIFDTAAVLTANKIYNRDILETAEWKDFQENMKSTAAKVQDDLEMVFAFFYYGRKLPFSHYALMKMPDLQDTVASNRNEPLITLEEKSPNTAYLKINSFGGTAMEMDSFFAVIKKKGYQNLIVDLRDNPGGSVEAGMAFASNLADTPFYGGIFLTQKWFNQHKQAPLVSNYSSFPEFSAANYQLIIQGIHNTDGLCMKVIPDASPYRGHVFILTDGGTASTCEPLVYGLKQHHYATIVGETTAGMMLNGEFFEMDEGFTMFIPTADYYTSDGYRIDHKGVKPDIQVKSADALNYVMANMIK